MDKNFTEPETVIDQLNLAYIIVPQWSIHRNKKGKDFNYQLNGKTLNDNAVLQRIKKLVIPPAWEEVKISHLINGHLQAIGREEKTRKQYGYHHIWNNIRNQTKFYKMGQVADNFQKSENRRNKTFYRDIVPRPKCLLLLLN